ncbi:MAG: insulinase family protein [Deltaproteobacteria bacterium]|nr:insulinase family protein [Deltaproteobacteria bacterium]
MSGASPSPLARAVPLAHRTPSGLRVLVLPRPGAHRVALVTEIAVGSRYETPRENGISHLLEHMLYRGIPGHETAHEQALAFETLGGTLSAATGTDGGSLAVSCPPETFAPTLELIARVFREPLLGGLEVEKRIVREEILEDLDEDGALVDDHDLLRALAYGGHPLGQPVIGTAATVDRLDRDALLRHHARHYVGRGAVIAIAGPVDPERIAREVERVFDGLAEGDELPIAPPPPQTAPRLSVVKSSASQTAIRLAFRGGGVRSADEPATELLLRLLDDGNSTRLYSRLCDELGLAYDVSAGYDAAADTGLLDIACEAAHATAPRVFEELLGVCVRLRDEGPSDAELGKAKSRSAWGLEELLDDTAGLAEFHADAASRGYPASLAERRAQLDGVSRDEVRAVAEKLLRPENLSAVVVGLPAARAQAQIRRLVAGFR